MSIQNVSSTPVCGQSRRAAAGAKAAGASFQDQLLQTAAGSPRSSFSRESLVKTDLLSALNNARNDILNRMREEAENEKEQKEWDALMKRVDRWIETLREGSELEKKDREDAGDKKAELEYEYITHVLNSLQL